MSSRKRQLVFVAFVLLAIHAAIFAQTESNERWVGTWSTSEVGRPQTPPPPAPALPPFQTNQCPAAPPAAPAFMHFNDQTLRQIVHTSIGGPMVRVVLSNVYGTAPLTIGAAHIALRDKDSSIQTASGRPLTFSGRPTVAIPAHAAVYSDPVNLTVPEMADLAIDLYLPGNTDTPVPLTMHNGAFQTNYVSETGNHVGSANLPTVAPVQNWFVIFRVDVQAPESVGGLVTFEDSITDGTRSTRDTNNRWPDQLVRRMLSQVPPLRMGVMNAAIAGYKQLIDQAHSKGLKIYGATLTPFYGAAYYTEVGEAKRQAVNQWIQTSKAYDAVIDFDAATRDPNEPKKLLAAYDSCDHLHPNDAGYKAMAEAVDLGLFKAAPASARTPGQ